MQLGFVGTGTMGHPMARCLLEAGHALTASDVRREATIIFPIVARILEATAGVELRVPKARYDRSYQEDDPRRG